MTQLETARVRYLPARAVPIVKATDLGSVQVLKHGNRFLLTDSFGDIHPDSRGLGSVRRRHARARLLRAAHRRHPAGPAADLGRRQLPGRDPDDESLGRPEPRREGPSARRAGRPDDRDQPRAADRRATASPSASRSSTTPRATSDVPVDLELGADGADIFEVRGYPRAERGRLLPVAVTDDRVTFRYVGLDGSSASRTSPSRSRPRSSSRSTSRCPTGPTPGPRSGCSWTLEPGTRRDEAC